MRRTINILLYCISTLLILWAVRIGGKGWTRHKADVKCQGVCVCVSDSTANKFIDNKGLQELIERDFDGVVNVHLQRISLTKLEQMLNDKPYLISAQAYFTADNILHADVAQLTPVFKYNTGGELYYIDCEGRSALAANDWKPSLLELKGEADLGDKEWMKQAGQMVQWAEGNGYLGKVSEITVKKGQLTVRLNNMQEEFDFGTLESYQNKWDKIGQYLKHIAPTRQGQKAYKNVCVKYKGQIVCK